MPPLSFSDFVTDSECEEVSFEAKYADILEELSPEPKLKAACLRPECSTEEKTKVDAINANTADIVNIDASASVPDTFPDTDTVPDTVPDTVKDDLLEMWQEAGDHHLVFGDSLQNLLINHKVKLELPSSDEDCDDNGTKKKGANSVGIRCDGFNCETLTDAPQSAITKAQNDSGDCSDIDWSQFQDPCTLVQIQDAVDAIVAGHDAGRNNNYVGICSGPMERWALMGPRSHKLRFSEMHVLAASGSSHLCWLEKAIIAHLKSNPCCVNVSSGGQNIRDTTGFLYLCWGRAK